jgi:molybdopterin synthase sulfur carrier subunit
MRVLWAWGRWFRGISRQRRALHRSLSAPAPPPALGHDAAMQIRVRYFASLREVLGEEARVDATGLATVGALRDRLCESSAAHAQALGRERAIRCALDQRLCADDTPLRDGAEVAFFPPVTGG